MAVWNPCANDVFLEALELAPGAREAYLDSTCGGDTALRAQVEALLTAHARAGSFLDTPAPGLNATLDVPLSQWAGATIGPYKLLEEIGEGGFGVVFLAEQTEPVRRQVALKLLKPGMDTGQFIARFEAERQALAMMDHPNIARIFDGGCTRGEPGGVSSGRPYFVMELVKGVPITEHCDQNHLTPRQRLELFIPVCQAVQHAHQKGVIHRDLKPSNVLVARHSASFPLDKGGQGGVVKVIDFGVAKALGESLTDKTLFTGIAQLIGTPHYMSPEQAGMSDLDVDTRSDIYALGVLLYELLTGTTPFTKDRFKRAAYDEIRRIIREEEPPKPSTRLKQESGIRSQGSNGQSQETSRSSPPDSCLLTPDSCQELDWIVMKALDKDRNRRYETANGFADDIQRYLNDQPVEACPPSWRYRCGKFVRRHKGAVLAASLVLLMLLGGIVGTTWGLLRAEENWTKAKEALSAETEARRAERRARDRAVAALDLMTEEIVQNRMTRQPHLLEEDKAFLRKLLEHFEAFAALAPNDPESRAVQAEGYAHVGAIRHRLGDLKGAEAAINDAVSTLKQLVTEFPARAEFRQDLGRSYNHLGMLHGATGKLAAAEACFVNALTVFTQLTTEVPADPEVRIELARTHTYLANHFREMGKLPEAEAAYGKMVTLYKQLAAELPDRPQVRMELARSYNNLALLRQETGRLQEAETLLGEALAIQKDLAANYHARPELRQELSGAHGNLGLLYRATNRWKEAEAAYREALAIRKQLVADYPVVPEYRGNLASAHAHLGLVYRGMGRNQDAETEYQRAITIQKQLAADFATQPKYRLNLARWHTMFGELLHDADRIKDAEAAFVEAMAIVKALVAEFPSSPEYRRDLAIGHNNLGVVYRAMKRLRKARAAYVEAVKISKQLAAESPTQPDLQNSVAGELLNLAHVSNMCDEFAFAKGCLDEAKPYHEAALKANPKHPDYRRAYRSHLLILVSTHACLKDQTAALRSAEKVRDLGWDPPRDTYDAASSLGVCIGIGKRHHLLNPAERQAASQFYTDHAMAMLRDAVAKGWKDVPHMEKDPDLEDLRPREEYQRLIQALKQKHGKGG